MLVLVVVAAVAVLVLVGARARAREGVVVGVLSASGRRRSWPRTIGLVSPRLVLRPALRELELWLFLILNVSGPSTSVVGSGISPVCLLSVPPPYFSRSLCSVVIVVFLNLSIYAFLALIRLRTRSTVRNRTLSGKSLFVH